MLLNILKHNFVVNYYKGSGFTGLFNTEEYSQIQGLYN